MSSASSTGHPVSAPAAWVKRLPLIGAVAAAVSAVLYYMIGFGVLDIGRSTSSTGDQNLVGFGVAAGTAFAVIALLMLLVRRRLVWTAIAVFDLLVIVMYAAVAPIRDPHVEAWGLTIKTLQIVLLATVTYLAVRNPDLSATSRTSRTSGRTRPDDQVRVIV